MNQKYNYFFLVVDDSLDFVPSPDLPNFYRLKFSDFNLSIPQNSGALLSHPKVIEYIQKTSPSFPVAIIPFKPSAKIQNICQKNKWLYIANPAKTNRILEDKIHFTQLCDQYHLPTIEHRLGKLNQKFIDQCQKEFGSPTLVVQTRNGWAGKSSFLLNSWSDIEKKIPKDTPTKVTPFLSGYTLLNNCCIYNSSLIQSPPALQLTGLKNLTVNPFSTVGRQWPSFAPNGIINQIRSITQNFYQIIKDKYNYRGYFGLDFFVNKDQVFLLECNPRLTASFAFYSHLELLTDLIPSFYYHLDEFSHSLNLSPPTDRFENQNIIGTQVTPKDENGVTKNTLTYDHPLVQDPNEISIPNI